MSRPKGPRHLRPEEAELWQKIADRTRPLRAPFVAPPAKPTGGAPKAPPPPPDPIRPFAIGERNTEASPRAAPSPPARVNMDAKAHRRLVRGKLTPEARLDLHGMTLAEAQPALTRFIMSAHSSGKRLVLVITGKGRVRDGGGPIPERPGVLRRQVPSWLRSGTLGAVVIQVAEAHQRHGGAGAFYVYLRRSK